jgi:hypothetical protein
LEALVFSAGVVVRRGSRSFCAVLVFDGEFRWTNMVAGGLCVVVVLAGSLGVVVLFFALRRNNVMVCYGGSCPTVLLCSIGFGELVVLSTAMATVSFQQWLMFRSQPCWICGGGWWF